MNTSIIGLMVISLLLTLAGTSIILLSKTPFLKGVGIGALIGGAFGYLIGIFLYWS